MKKNIALAAGLLLTILAFPVCFASDDPQTIQPDAEEMMVMASRLTKLSTAVESTVRYKNPPPDLDESELLQLSVKHDPQLLESLAGFKLRVLSQNKHAVVLVCSTEGGQRLLEDAGCTATMDKHHWRDLSQTECTFTINVVTDCP